MDDRRTGGPFELVDAIVWFTVRQVNQKIRIKKTHLRVYNDLKDSKNGWSSVGVADSAVAIKSSKTSFGGWGRDICAS